MPVFTATPLKAVFCRNVRILHSLLPGVNKPGKRGSGGYFKGKTPATGRAHTHLHCVCACTWNMAHTHTQIYIPILLKPPN